MTKKEIIYNYAQEHNVPFATAEYALARGESYKPRQRKGLTLQDLYDLDIYLQAANNVYGWRVFQLGKERPIFPLKTGNYKSSGRVKYHPYVVVSTPNKKQRMISLASIIMVYIKLEDIKPGEVVDHIDNDSFNNDPDNLQILTIRQNLDKDNKGHNQYKHLGKSTLGAEAEKAYLDEIDEIYSKSGENK